MIVTPLRPKPTRVMLDLSTEEATFVLALAKRFVRRGRHVNGYYSQTRNLIVRTAGNKGRATQIINALEPALA